MKPESTTFKLAADDLDEAVAGAVEHLQRVVEEDGLAGFVVPELIREAFEFREGKWLRTFQFRAELIAAGA